MSARYSDYDDLIRDLDQEGLADDQFGPSLDDEDLALLGEIAPDKPRPRPRPAASKSAPKKTPAKRKPAAKKP